MFLLVFSPLKYVLAPEVEFAMKRGGGVSALIIRVSHCLASLVNLCQDARKEKLTDY